MIHLLLGWFLQVDDRPKTPVSIFFGFSGEFDFNVPNEEMSAITHRIIQGEQALQMYQCQMQTYQYQMNPLQAQAHIQQFRLMSQRGHVTDTQRSVLPDCAVSEPQNQVDTRRRSRSRPPLTDDRRRIDRVEESTRGPTGVASSSQLPVPERSTPKILTHGLFYHSHTIVDVAFFGGVPLSITHFRFDPN